MNCKTKLQLYLSAILPHLTYCQTVWHFCKQSERRKLERLQERTLRVIYNCRTDTYEDLLRRAKLPFLYNRRLQEIVTLMYKVRNGLDPDYICELFSFKNKVYSLRNADFDVPRYSTVRYGKHSISLLVIGSNHRWTILDGTLGRKTWLLLLRVHAATVLYAHIKYDFL